jgi:hypothetical protein
MVECFNERLSKAQCCALAYSNKYVVAMSHGEATDQMFNTLMLLDAYLSALERYNSEPWVCVDHTGYIKYSGSFLSFKGKALYLSGASRSIFVEPDCCNCVTEEEVNKIFEQISVVCGGCSCNCA